MEREMYHRLTLHPSLLLMASPSVTSASLMIDLKGDEKTPHPHLTPSSLRESGEGDIYIFDPFRDGSPSPSNEQKCASKRSRSGKDNGKSGRDRMRDARFRIGATSKEFTQPLTFPHFVSSFQCVVL